MRTEFKYKQPEENSCVLHADRVCWCKQVWRAISAANLTLKHRNSPAHFVGHVPHNPVNGNVNVR